LFDAFNALNDNTQQYYLTTTAGGSTTTTLDLSAEVDSNGNFINPIKFRFYRTAGVSPFTQVQITNQEPFTSLEQYFNANLNLNTSGGNVPNQGASISVVALTDDYSQVSITINNPPSAVFGFYRIEVITTVVVASAFTSVYNTTAPPVGAGISIEDNAFGDGGLNYREFLREATVSPIVCSKITATFSNKSDAFEEFEITQSSLNEQGVTPFRMARSPYLNGNAYVAMMYFVIDGFFGLNFNLSAGATVDMQFWDVKQNLQGKQSPNGLEDNLLGL
jgi:hypothetical protein